MNICLVAHFAFGALIGGASGHVGGVERQTSLMAKWLAAKGHNVTLLTWDEGQPKDCIIDRVRVIKMCKRQAGLWGVRFFHPRWTSLNKALALADADIYYQNCGEYITGQVAFWCRWQRKKFVYSTANDVDCDPKLPIMSLREKILYRYGINKCDRIIAQTTKQQSMLQEGFGLPSTVLPMPCSGASPTDYRPPTFPNGKPFHVGWAARISKEKRLDFLLDIARALPDVIFEIGGAPSAGGEDYAQPIIDAARSLPNIILHGRVPREDMPKFYERLHLFCCTSAYEGFPNTFLEAWSHGLPIVSTFDPDGLITEQSLGRVAIDTTTLIYGIESFMHSPGEWQLASQRVRDYYLQNHTVDEVMVRFERLFLEVLAKSQTNTVKGEP